MSTGRGMLPAIRALRAAADGEAPPAIDAWARNETALVVEWLLREAGAVRFDHARRAWFLFDGQVWRPDRDGAVRRRLQSYLEWKLQEAVSIDRHQDRDPLVAYLTRQLRAAHIPRLQELAEHQSNVATAGDDWDGRPMLLACPNGTIDLETMEFRDGDRRDYLTKQTIPPYDPCARAPRWLQFVLDVCSDDPDRAEYLQRVMGYALTGSTDEQCFWIHYGAGANGKSTLTLVIMRHVIPEHSWSMAVPTATWSESLSEYQRASLVGRRLVAAHETESGKRLHVEFIKSLTGGDEVNARHPYGRPFTYRPQAKLFLAVNHRPVIRDDGHGMWRRVRLVPFERTFPLNPDFAESLIVEAQGILAWMVRGAFAWAREGLCTPASVLAATEEYRHDSDHVATFLEDRCIVADEALVRASALFEAYRVWCDANGVLALERLTQKPFGQRMRRDFTAIEGRQVTFRGLGLRDGDRP
jgi:putative DNA primase/helicase